MALFGGFCDNGVSPLWSNADADCFRYSALLIVPSAFLCLFLPVLLYDLRNAASPIRCRSPATLRLVLYSVLEVVVAVLCLNTIHNRSVNGAIADSQRPDSLQLFAHILLLLSISVAFAGSVGCRSRGIISSGVLFIFHFFLVFASLPEFLAHLGDWSANQQVGVHGKLYLIYFVLISALWFFCCFADRRREKPKKNVCPELYSSFLNQVTFQWFTGLSVKGYFSALTIDDLWDLDKRDETPHVAKQFYHLYQKGAISGGFFQFSPQRLAEQSNGKAEKITLKSNGTSETHALNVEVEEEKKEKRPSVVWPLAQIYKWELLAAGFYKLLFDVIQFGFPQLLKLLISFIQSNSQSMAVGVSIAVCMFLLATAQSLILHQYFHLMFRVGMNIRSILTAAVFRKALFLSSKARKNATVGSIVTLMAADVQRFQEVTTYVMLFWSAPLQVALTLFFLYRLLGFTVIAGFFVFVLMIPLNIYLSSRIKTCQVRLMECKDRRLRALTEVCNGIRMVKLFGWETEMEKKILAERREEVAVLRRLAFLNAAASLSWSVAPFIVAVTTFGIYVMYDPENNVLTPQITFVALSLFNILRFPMAVAAIVFSQFMQFRTSNTRIKAFLAADELDDHDPLPPNPNGTAILMDNATFTWEPGAYPILSKITLDIPQGSLVAVVGRIGSGKTSLLQALLGEMHRVSGIVNIEGRIAYVPQQPWIQNLTLRDNILFGLSLDEEFYGKVMNACALSPDLASLPAGDLTEIGEKGINLSGGQKQRISLARAVYADADLYFLDDPLSAVDAHVGQALFEGVVTGLLAKKTRLFVTHSLTYLKRCDHIIVMKGGQISESGSYERLKANSGEFAAILDEFLNEEAKSRGRSVSFGENESEIEEVLEDLTPSKKVEEKEDNLLGIENKANRGQSSTSFASTEKAPVPNPVIAEPPNAAKARLIEGETVETGKVNFRVYGAYIRAIGYPVLIFFLLMYILSSSLGVKSNLWLADWSDEALRNQRQNLTTPIGGRLGMYALLGMGQAFFVTLATILVSLGMVRASWVLHEQILHGVLRSAVAFFDVTPLGRILNRFSKDLDMVDSRLPNSILNFVGSIIQSLAILCVPVIVTPQVALPLVVIMLVYICLANFYLNTSRQLKRLEAVTRSPIFSHFGESIQGATSIRAYGAVDRFVAASQDRVDRNLKTFYPSLVANRWLSVRLELIGNLIVLSAALFAVLFREDGVTAGLVGVSVSYAFNVTQTLNWAVRMSSELESNIVSIERIQEYAERPTEPQIRVPEGTVVLSVSDSWPQKGAIQFQNVSLRYRDELDEVLHDVDFSIAAGEKMGIVGRTGSGKSTLALALLRIVEPSQGRIFIDGVDIAHIPLETLRLRLTVVPQDPVLFSGTIQSNLDPTNVATVDELWNALELAHLRTFIESLPDQLEYKVTESGSNLSVGQRQLLCLARALLRRPRVLILDEASASVDMETDALVHRTIAQHFQYCTVLTIAHRLNWMFESDRILAMDGGRVAQLGTPNALWADESSIFHSLAVESDLQPNQIVVPKLKVTAAESDESRAE